MRESGYNQDELLSAFVIKMMQDRGLPEMSEDQRERMRLSLQGKLQRRIEESLIGMLSDEEVIKLGEKLEAGMTDEEIEDYFVALSGESAEQIMTNAMKVFREAFLSIPVETIMEGV